MVVPSLGMRFSIVDGGVQVDADWLEEPVVAPTWHSAYWLAMSKRR